MWFFPQWGDEPSSESGVCIRFFILKYSSIETFSWPTFFYKINACPCQLWNCVLQNFWIGLIGIWWYADVAPVLDPFFGIGQWWMTFLSDSFSPVTIFISYLMIRHGNALIYIPPSCFCGFWFNDQTCIWRLIFFGACLLVHYIVLPWGIWCSPWDKWLSVSLKWQTLIKQALRHWLLTQWASCYYFPVNMIIFCFPSYFSCGQPLIWNLCSLWSFNLFV